MDLHLAQQHLFSNREEGKGDLPERERLCNLADFSRGPAGVPVLSRGEADDDVEGSCYCWDDSIFLGMRCLAEPVTTAMFFLFEVAGIVSRYTGRTTK